MRWSHAFTGPEEQWIADVTRDPAGNLFLAGGISGPVDFGGGVLTGEVLGAHYVAKRDPDGNHLWAKTLGDQDSLGDGSLATDANGNVIYAGQTFGAVDFGNGPLQTSGFIGAFDPDGDNIALTGIFYDDFSFPGGPVLPGDGIGQVYVAKLSSTGAHLWSIVLAPSAYPAGLAFDSAGNLVVPLVNADPESGAETAGLTQLDASGAVTWDRTLGPSTSISTVTIDATDRILIAGAFLDTLDLGGGPLTQSPPAPYAGSFLALLAADGTHVWSKGLGNAGQAFVMDSEVDAMGRIHLSGLADVSIDFGGGPLPATGTQLDGFIAVLDGDGNHVASTVRGGPDADGFAFLTVDDAGNTVVTSTYHVDGFDLGGGPLLHTDSEDMVVASFALP